MHPVPNTFLVGYTELAIIALLVVPSIWEDCPDVSQGQLTSAPVPVLAGSALLALTVAGMALKLRWVGELERAMHYLAGSLLGGLGGFLIYLLSPFPVSEFFSFVLLGVVCCGMVGVLTGFEGIRFWRQ